MVHQPLVKLTLMLTGYIGTEYAERDIKIFIDERGEKRSMSIQIDFRCSTLSQQLIHLLTLPLRH